MSKLARVYPLVCLAACIAGAYVLVPALGPTVVAQGGASVPPSLTLLDESSETVLLMPEVTRPRQRAGRLSPALVAGLSGNGRPVASRVSLNLFPNVVLTAVLERAENVYNGKAWVGRLEGEPRSLVAFGMVDGALSGTVTSDSGIYEISADASGAVTVSEVDASRLAPEAAPLVPRLAPGDSAPAEAFAPPVAGANASQTVAVFWTPTAQRQGGGASRMASRVVSRVAATNAAYRNSGVLITLKLVHSGQISYTQSGNALTDLNRFTSKTDAYMNAVHATRATKKADLMALIVGNSSWSQGACGIAWLLQPAFYNVTRWKPYTFSWTVLECMPTFTFEHELGHNQGAHHDSYVTGGQHGFNTFSHGYVDLTARIETIMAYRNRCAAAGKSCTRIPYFSNPLKKRNGRAVGTASANNAKTLNTTAAFIARLN